VRLLETKLKKYIMRNEIGSERFFFEDLKVIFLFKKKLIIAPVMYDNRLELEISNDNDE
tara:strand:+ start:575 stop:751 length:177 start_codon:yes stop_codon:yes gene_type:complete